MYGKVLKHFRARLSSLPALFPGITYKVHTTTSLGIDHQISIATSLSLSGWEKIYYAEEDSRWDSGRTSGNGFEHRSRDYSTGMIE